MPGKNKRIIDADDAVLLLIDPQSGLFQLVKDMELTDLRANVTALAKTAYLAKIPTFTTASVPDGPNGPLIPEVHAGNPDAVYIPRTGQINAWDNPLWTDAIRKTGRKTLIMAGTVTSVCLALPALSAIEEGYRVFAVFDASGNWSKMGTDITMARLAQAGVMPVDTFAVMCEVMGTWNRPDSMQFGQIMADHVMPHYRLLFESFDKAQKVVHDGPETKLDKLKP